MAKILQVFNRYLHPGGEEKSVKRIRDVLSLEHVVEYCEFDSKAWSGPGAISKPEQICRMFYNPASRDLLEKKCQEFQPDILLFHNVYPVGSPSLYHAAVRLGVPVVQYVHNFRPLSVGGTLYAQGKFLTQSLNGNFWAEIFAGAWQNSKIKTAIFALVLKFLWRSGWLQHVQAWVCISAFMRDKFAEGGVSTDRLFVLPHAWENLDHPPLANDQGYYLLLSRLVEEKGIKPLLEAWEILAQRLGENCPELHIGGEGPLKELVIQAADKNSRVKYLGLIANERKSEELTQCRAVIFPSIWWEPLGLVSYEAYDHGKPVLAAASGGLTETVQDGVTGFLHEPGNVNDLVNTVIKMESLTPDRRVEMGQIGRQWLLANTNVMQWKERFNDILRSIGVTP